MSFYRFALFMLALALVLQTNLPALDRGVVYVQLFMHNEDSALGDFSDPQTRQSYLRQRNGLIEFANMIKSHNLSFCWQSDWKFLQGVLKYETPELMAVTNNKNLLRWFKEDMGFSVDPHSHEHYGYNYADVAHLMDSLGVAPTSVIGGHIYDPYSEKFQDWERFRTVLAGAMYPWAQWQGNILMGSGTPNHTSDPAPSGVWRPESKFSYWTDDPDGNIICVGQYTGSVSGVQELVQLYKTGQIDPRDILTASIYVGQSFPTGAIAEYEQTIINPLLAMAQAGEIKIVNFVELIDIWKSQYAGKPHIYNAPQPAPDTISTFIPSETAGDVGLYAKIIIPESNRYTGLGSPVVVHVAGGWDGVGIAVVDKQSPLRDFIQIVFNFPGSGYAETRSGGSYDDRGELCIRALRDVARFAMGALADQSGKYLHDYTASITPLYDNVGLCGWSNGGNATITVAGAFAEQLSNLAWIVNWESPVGDGMPNVEAGGSHGNAGPNVNPAYDPNTGNWSMNLLAYDPAMAITDKNLPTPFTGGFYFDINQNGQVDQGVDFILTPQIYHDKVYYSERVAQAAAAAHIPGGAAPAHISTLNETQNYWLYRNGENWMSSAVQKNSRLMFIVEASTEDHVQAAPDHPHVLIQYEGFRQAGCRFVRLNPDRSYMEQMAGQAMPQAVDNDAFAAMDHLSIRSALQPAGASGVITAVGVAAAVAEVADRTQNGNLQPQIDPGVTTAVAEKQLPDDLALWGNYPNPFNPATTIVFSLYEPAKVNLAVFDIMGRTVAVLLDEQINAGQHQVRCDLGNASNGLYFYRLTTGRETRFGRMLLLR